MDLIYNYYLNQIMLIAKIKKLSFKFLYYLPGKTIVYNLFVLYRN